MRPLLLCYDGSDDARRAIREAAALFPGRDAIVLYVSKSVVDWGFGPAFGPVLLDIPGVDEAILELANRTLDEGVQLAREAGFHPERDIRMTATAVWRTVLEVADDHDVSLIVAGSHGERLRDVLPLGSVAHGLLSHATRPLLITHRGDVQLDLAELRLLLAYDGSPIADHAIEAIAELFPGADVHVATSWERVQHWGESTQGSSVLRKASSEREQRLQTVATGIADRGARLAREHGLQSVPLLAPTGEGVGTAMLQLAREVGSDVIVLGTHGHGLVARVLLGSTAHWIVQHADRPVLVVPPPMGAAPDDAPQAWSPSAHAPDRRWGASMRG